MAQKTIGSPLNDSSVATTTGSTATDYTTPLTVMTWPITEIFGPVIQGEGMMVGVQTMFLRVAGCDDRCVWCDTKISVEPELIKVNSTRMTSQEIIHALTQKSVAGNGCKTVTISGGNPAIHNLEQVVRALRSAGWKIALETQGTIWRTWMNQCHVLTISPKPPSSGNITDCKRISNVLTGFGKSMICVKIVCFDDADYEYAVKAYELLMPHVNEFYLQPGTDTGTMTEGVDLVRSKLLNQTRWLIEKVIVDQRMPEARIVPQMHALVYGHARGV